MGAREKAQMSDDRRADEMRRREQAQAHRGEVVEGSGSAIDPRSVPQMMSVRLDAILAAQLREVAESRGTSLSDVLREAAQLVVSAYMSPTASVKWSRVDRWTGVSVSEVRQTTSSSSFPPQDFAPTG